MGPEELRDLREMRSKLDGVCNAVEVGFAGLRTEMKYIARYNTMSVMLASVALFLATLALVIAMENRALILDLNRLQPQRERVLPAEPGVTPENVTR